MVLSTDTPFYKVPALHDILTSPLYHPSSMGSARQVHLFSLAPAPRGSQKDGLVRLVLLPGRLLHIGSSTVLYLMHERPTCICRYTVELCGSPSINPSFSKNTFFGLLWGSCQSLKHFRKSRTYLSHTIFWNSRHGLEDCRCEETVGATTCGQAST